MVRRSPLTCFDIRPLGDQALVIDFGEQIDPMVNARACAVANRLLALAWPGVVDVVPSYSTVTVHLRIDRFVRTERGNPVAAFERRLRRWMSEEAPDAAPSADQEIEIPVCFGGIYGPDLAEAASACGMSIDEIVAAHKVPARVYMLGFAPGAPYIGLYDERVSLPRRATPRMRVPAGSIGIANRQCVVYPVEAPGGWSIIGRTPLKFFDFDRPSPTLLRPGSSVRLTSISEAQLSEWPSP
jgi:KipI family sensor histidine kinase inhibitor